MAYKKEKKEFYQYTYEDDKGKKVKLSIARNFKNEKELKSFLVKKEEEIEKEMKEMEIKK